ncbi:uncharacterized protein LOC141710835 [Apium graveolens]|uniref:uncharacterized protein LOC141710835 n=1 Tax=Apium graveolens TaxID=4045 RepID=UPI003D7B2AB2
MEAEEVIDNKLYTIAEIKKFTEEYIQNKVRFQVNVKKVEEKNNWYDNFCTTCGDEVNIVAERYKCETCKRNIPYPDIRFRLAVVCKDVTGVIAMVFDEEIYRLTGKDVFDIENDDNQVGDGINFPPMLKSFENRDYIVTLLIEEKNTKKSCSVYTVYALDEPVEMLGNHTPGDTVDITSNADSVTMGIDLLSK